MLEDNISVESPKPPVKLPTDPIKAKEPIVEKNPQTPLEKAPSPKINEIGGGLDTGLGGGSGGSGVDDKGVFGEPDSDDGNHWGDGVSKMDTKHEERATSFFAQPGILAVSVMFLFDAMELF
ncbi:hypothetical protein J437_LFUL005813 [Ladona fulva]|uniref:Uncharacterized protein n=1 Tax=Ladona fulva TaxID=123851 RepID=A0A8K0K1Z2_LADFU|nr:hypothetical protein J437_LFUL005813 [Ladona fulva]